MPPTDSATEADSSEGPQIAREFWCFISYRRTDNLESGREWVTWLQQQLETYEIPPDLVGTKNERGQEIPAQIFPVFRDEDELSAGELDVDITEALDASKTLVVVCSPRITESRYCADEIRYFKSLIAADERRTDSSKRPTPFLAVIAGDPLADKGSPSNCFPDPIRYEVDERGELTADPAPESLWLDLRLPDGSEGWASKEAHRGALVAEGCPSARIGTRVAAHAEQLAASRLRLIAGILGVPLGELTRRDKAHQLEKARKRQRLTAILATVFLVLAVAAIIAGVIAVRNEKRTRETLAQSDFAEGLRRSNEGDTPEALAYFARSLRNDPDNRVARAHLESRLRRRWWVAPEVTLPLPPEVGEVHDAEFFNGSFVAILSADSNPGEDGGGAIFGNQVWLMDLETGQATKLLQADPGMALLEMKGIDSKEAIQVVRRTQSDDWELLLLDRGGKVSWQAQASDPDHLALSSDGRRAAIIEGDQTRVVDTGGRVINVIPGEASTVHLNREGSRALLTLNRVKATLLETDTGRSLLEVIEPTLVGNPRTCQLSPEGTTLTYLTRDLRFFRGDLRDGDPKPTVLRDFGGTHFFPLDRVAFSPSNEHLFFSRNHRVDYTEVALFESQYGSEIYQRLIPESNAIADLAFDRSRMLSLAVPNGIWTFELPEGRDASDLVVHEPVRTTESPRTVAFSETGQLLSIDGSQLNLWNLPSGPGGRESEYRDLDSGGALAFLSETELLVEVGGNLFVYNLEGGGLEATGIPVSDSVSERIPAVADRNRGRLLLPVRDDNGAGLEIWDLKAGNLLQRISTQSVETDEGFQLASEGGHLILDGRAWRIGDEGNLESHSELDALTAISPGGDRVLRLTAAGSEVWDVIKKEKLGSSSEKLTEVIFDRAGSALLCRHPDDSIRLWPVDLSNPLSPPLRFDVDELQPYAVDGDFVVLRSNRRVGRRHRARGFVVFDNRSFGPVTRPVFEEFSSCTLLLSPGFGTMVEWNEEKPLRVVPLFSVGDPNLQGWLPDVAESVGGLRLDRSNVFQILTVGERKKILNQYSTTLRLEGFERLAGPESEVERPSPIGDSID